MRQAATIRVFIAVDGDATEKQFDTFVADMQEHFQAEAYYWIRQEHDSSRDDGGMDYKGKALIQCHIVKPPRFNSEL